MIQPVNLNTNKSIPVNKTYVSSPSVQMPTEDRNYCLFNKERIDSFVSQKEQALPYVKEVLKNSKDEKEIVEALCILDKLIDNGTKGIPAMYPILARYNNTDSPNIQSYLAGIYRKTQVPDAFGPLIKMLIKNSLLTDKYSTFSTDVVGFSNPTNSSQFTVHSSPFDPNEEIGGAILEYIRNYSNNPKQIDYTA